MTDEPEPEQPFEPEATFEVPAAEGVVTEGFGDEIVASAYPGESIVHRIAHPDPLGELKDAAKWGYHKLIPEKPDEPEPEPGGIVIDLPPSEEEVTMRSTWVEHDDPPPPPPPHEPPAGHGR